MVLFNNVSDDTVAEIGQMFTGSAYASSDVGAHTLTADGYERPVTRSFLQAELVCSLLDGEDLSILDIGCFNGALLVEFDRRLKSVDLHGFDVNDHLRATFPVKDNFRFWSSNIESIDGQFDVICMSHSIMYVQNIHRLMTQIRRLMKPDSVLFVQTPNIAKNPYYALMGDQYSYYTPNILRNVFLYHGLELSLVDNRWFPREIVGIARRHSYDADRDYSQDAHIEQCLKYLDTIAMKLDDLSADSRIGVLGTTANAAFVDSRLGEKLDFFVDENHSRVGTRFRDKEVLHPRSLDDSDLLIVPYGESSRRIKRRLEDEYRGRFMVL